MKHLLCLTPLLLVGACAFRPSVEEWQPWTETRLPRITLNRTEVQAVGPDRDGRVRFLGPNLQLINSGAGSFPWAVSSPDPWLGVSGVDPWGLLPAGESQEVPLEIQAAKLPAGQVATRGRLEVRNSVTLKLVATVQVDWRRTGSGAGPMGGAR